MPTIDYSTPSTRTTPWPVVVVAGWIIPGAGHFLYGERARGIVIGVTVLVLFALGVLVGGVRVVEFPDFSIQGNLIAKLLSSPAFLGQFFVGPLALVCGHISNTLANNLATAGIIAHARLADLAALYTGVAGGLNLLAIIDSTGRAAAGMPPRDGVRESAQVASEPLT